MNLYELTVWIDERAAQLKKLEAKRMGNMLPASDYVVGQIAELLLISNMIRTELMKGG